MQSCAAPLPAETSMRVSTPNRHCSGGMSLTPTTIIDPAPSPATTARLVRHVRACPRSSAARKRYGTTELCCTAARTGRMAWVIEAHLDQSPMDRSMTPSPQKVALVTGAARGIGLAVAKRFLAEG